MQTEELDEMMSSNIFNSSKCFKEMYELKLMKQYNYKIVWKNVLMFFYIHVAAIYGLYLMFTSAKYLTIIWALLLYVSSGLGITAGVHRLWSHRCYKANFPLRLMLAIFNTIAFQNSIYEWARDHRLHHKYADTDADPHNAARGFFFSHVGWLLVRKHPEVIEKGKEINMTDLENDSIVKFQKEYYRILVPLCCFILPTLVPIYFWNETLINAWHIATIFRYCFTLHCTWFVNSAAHMWGTKPYNKNIKPTDNLLVCLGTLGEGWHNYHHTFPNDYRTGELGKYSINFSTAFIDFFTKIGWASDLKTISYEQIGKTGNSTYQNINSSDMNILNE